MAKECSILPISNTENQRKNAPELKKHVATIHANNKLSLLQRKIANALLFNAYDQLLERDEHQIHIKTLCELIGYDSNDHKTIKKTLVNLLSTVLEWNLVDGKRLDSDGVWNASSIIADASIDGSICYYSYSNKMRQLLYRPEIYGRINMQIQARFKSSYGLALYENCVRYQNIKQTPWFDLSLFRKLMGVEEGKYFTFRDFKRRVLDKAIAEVNQHSNIVVSPKLKKQGRVVQSIQFIIDKNLQIPVSDGSQAETQSSHAVTQLQRDFGFSQDRAKEILSAYEEQYVLEKIALVQSSTSYRQGKIVNLAKYLEAALTKNYQLGGSDNMSNTIAMYDPKHVEWQEQYLAYQNQQILQYLADQKFPQPKDRVIQGFEKFINKGVYASIYSRDGMDNILIRDQFCEFIRAQYPEWLNALLSFTEFCEVHVTKTS